MCLSCRAFEARNENGVICELVLEQASLLSEGNSVDHGVIKFPRLALSAQAPPSDTQIALPRSWPYEPELGFSERVGLERYDLLNFRLEDPERKLPTARWLAPTSRKSPSRPSSRLKYVLEVDLVRPVW